MAKDLGAEFGNALTQILREMAAEATREEPRRKSRLSGMRGVAVGAGLVAIVPLARKLAGGPVKRKLAKAAAKHVAKKPAKAVSDLASRS